jgi:spore coat polysaccharide biosynthesis protein SpsF
VAVVQARTSSQRLPGKVLLPLAPLHAGDAQDATVLDWSVARVARAGSVDDVAVATSVHPSDDGLAAHARRHGMHVSRGSLDDVLLRLVAAAEELDADVLVRVTADCPLVDPDVIDDVLAAHLRGGHDFTANRLPPPRERTFPIGLDVEVASMDVMRRSVVEATERHHREHVMPYLYESAGRFDVHVVDTEEDAGTVRWTVDTAADLVAVRALVEAASADVGTGWHELLRVWRASPALQRLNADVVQKTARDVDPRA